MREYKFRAWDNYYQEMINWEQFHGALCGGYTESNLKNANQMLKIGNVFENPELIREGR